MFHHLQQLCVLVPVQWYENLVLAPGANRAL